MSTGPSFRPVPTRVDDRGSVCEVFDPRWGWHPAPRVFSCAPLDADRIPFRFDTGRGW